MFRVIRSTPSLRGKGVTEGDSLVLLVNNLDGVEPKRIVDRHRRGCQLNQSRRKVSSGWDMPLPVEADGFGEEQWFRITSAGEIGVWIHTYDIRRRDIVTEEYLAQLAAGILDGTFPLSQDRRGGVGVRYGIHRGIEMLQRLSVDLDENQGWPGRHDEVGRLDPQETGILDLLAPR